MAFKYFGDVMKKLFAALLICILLTVSAFAQTYAGDMDDDGTFSLSDVLVLMHAIGEEKTSEEDLWCMDIDNSDDVTLKEALLLLKNSLDKKKPSFCTLHNVYHRDCVLSNIEIGSYSVFSFGSAEYDFRIRYKILVPSGYTPSKSYGLAVHLHGLGGENKATSDLSGSTYFTNISRSYYGDKTILLLPQCPVGMTWPDDRDTIEATYELIEYLSEHINIDKNRIYLSGHSNGSKGVAYMIMEHPNTFAAAVMGSGASAMKYYTKIENIATTPIWLFCGSADPVSGFLTNVRTLYKTLLEMDADVKYTEFPGLEHNIFSTVGNTTGLVDWVFSKSL